MKSLSLFLSLSIALFGGISHSQASQCRPIFENNKQVSADLRDAISELNVNTFAVSSQSKNAGEALIQLFRMILKAPNGSTVKIYSNAVKFDGIGSLLLLTSLTESFKSRGLKFEFRINDVNSNSRFHDLLLKRSTNKIFFRQVAQKTSMDETLVVVQSKDDASFMSFSGELTSSNLKDQSLKSAMTIKYEGRDRMRASPFKNDIVVTDGEGISRTTLENLKSFDQTYATQGKYSRENSSEVQAREMMDLEGANSVTTRANDLALQLYINQHGRAPTRSMQTMDILKRAILSKEELKKLEELESQAN